jgi:iron(III) transport system substrate-binding protein
MRATCLALFFTLAAGIAGAESYLFPAPDGADGPEIAVYSTLDEPLAAPLIAAFQARHPGIAVRYEDLLAGEIAARVMSETDAGGATADLVFSSAMDLQVKLANDGYARPVALDGAAEWPRWANWRDMAFAVTFEPAVVVYHRPSFPDGPPTSRLDLINWLRAVPPGIRGRIGTYDIERSAVGYLFLARDAEHFPDVWSLIAAMARAGLGTYATSQEIIDRVADGRLALGYNILGSYAADRARVEPDLGLVAMRDYTVVVSRVALVPRAARAADLGGLFLEFLISAEGQSVLSEGLRLPAVPLDLRGAGSGGAPTTALTAVLGDQLRPVAVSPGLLVYLDQAKRRLLIDRWRSSLRP